MEDTKEFEGVMSDYFGFDLRKLLIFCGLVFAVVVVVTGIYVAIFGFDSWKNSMTQAGDLMLAAQNVPMANGAAGTMVMQSPAPQAGAQYNCPTCGTTGLPMWNANGSPLCPACGALMGIAGNVGGGNMSPVTTWP